MLGGGGHNTEQYSDAINDAVEKWKQNICMFLSTQTVSTSINEIYNRVQHSNIIPRSIKLIEVLKYLQ